MKFRLYLSLILLLLALVAAKDAKTGSISGVVTESAKGKLPISGITVICSLDNNRITDAITDQNGFYRISGLAAGKYKLEVSNPSYKTWTKKQVRVCKNRNTKVNITLEPAPTEITDALGTEHVNIAAYEQALSQIDNIYSTSGNAGVTKQDAVGSSSAIYPAPHAFIPPYVPPNSTEDYNPITPNIFHSTLDEPLSTFAIDVDTADYSNIRRMLTQNMLPEPRSVRIEELLNYFEYDYPQPEGKHPFAVYSEMGVCPWNQKRNLVHIGLQGRKLNLDAAPPSNLVFLIDVSGSMNTYNKLPLVKDALGMLTDNLRAKDRVAIVVYAGAAGLVLPSTYGDSKSQIRYAMDQLQAGGSTAGGAGIELAYKTATENFIPGGNNRIILCTDGDFNVGASSDAHLTQLVEDNRNKGVYLTVLGFGMGNIKDNKMELLADKGNGNYAYIDTINEAKKVLVNEMVSTLYTIAKDVKVQVEFNPAHIKAYRLIGYENRLLNKEDFKDDTKDAGELGAGHTVTAVYEVIPAESKETLPELDKLKYQETRISEEALKSPEALTVKLRYKLPESDTSIPFDVPVPDKTNALENCSQNFLFSAAVIGYGMLLQESDFKAALTWDMVKELAKNNLGKDGSGYRKDFLELVQTTSTLWEKKHAQEEEEKNRDFNKGE